ncbi:MAG: RNase adapter RapZ [Alphaproteobacteria bacterium]|nr:RNase adapter RapZ [Alphaproteobacteria bacterium]
MLQSAEFIIISGLSGAGHTTVLRAFEDNGYIAIDNLPLPFLLSLRELYNVPVAVSIDTRTLGFSPDTLMKTLTALKTHPIPSHFLFLECEESVLLTRYNQTRRPHPLSGQDLKRALREEFELMRPLRAFADEVLDTSHKASDQTSLWVREHFCAQDPKIILQLTSFSYRGGIPPQADMVLDGRFLANPFYESALRPLTGRDEPVQHFLERDPLWNDFKNTALHLIHQSLDGFKKRGRSYVTVAVGCTGGQHRSVFIVETLSKLLQDKEIILGVEHRELKKIG